MSTTDTGGPAFPSAHPHGREEGMTILDYFAAKAMQAVIARGDDRSRLSIAEWSYLMAEAMVKEKKARQA